jgi:hypothetical protein
MRFDAKPQEFDRPAAEANQPEAENYPYESQAGLTSAKAPALHGLESH